MEVITVISATNRKESLTAIVAQKYKSLLENSGVEVRYYSLTDLPADFIHSDMYGERSEQMKSVIEFYISGVNKFVFIAPEYNGSYPGILKTFIDGIPPRLFNKKKAGIIGVSSGHAGNLRGQEHLTGVLHYLKMFVHYNKLKLSNIDRLIGDSKQLNDESTLSRMQEHALDMVTF